MDNPMDRQERTADFIEGACCFLEDQYHDFVRAEVELAVPRKEMALIAAQPLIDVAEAFLRLVEFANVPADMLRNQGITELLKPCVPLWALLFVCLRCGDREACNEVLQRASATPTLAMGDEVALLRKW